MNFSVEHKNNLWKIKTPLYLDNDLNNFLKNNSSIYCSMDDHIVYSFEDLKSFVDSCCKLRDNGYSQ